MIDRLRDVLAYLEQLPPEAQEEVAAYIEALVEMFVSGHIRDTACQIQKEYWQDPKGAWSDLPETLLEELNQLRHANPPTSRSEHL